MTVIDNRDVFGIEGEVRLSEAGPRDFFALLKPRVMSLVVFTALAGLVLAPGEINPIIGFIAILCIAVGAGASGALNMWYDADIDAVMSRTATRPVPAGRVTPPQAVDSSATMIAPGASSRMVSFRFWRNAIASRFSRPPYLFGIHCPSLRL